MVKEVGLPQWAQIKKIVRDHQSLTPEPRLVIQPDDELVVTAPAGKHPELEDVFTRWRRRV